MFSSLDETALFLIAARNTGGSWQKQVPAYNGKRPLTPAAHHSQSAGETTNISQSGSITPPPTGQVGSKLEWLDHFLILHEKQLQRVLNGDMAYFNRAPPHQGIRQQLPEPPASPAPSPHPSDKIIGIPILGGLHHDYQRAA